MVDVPVLGTGVFQRVGSSPTKGNLVGFTKFKFFDKNLFGAIDVPKFSNLGLQVLVPN